MNEIALKLCDIQGRLFELSADHNYGIYNAYHRRNKLWKSRKTINLQ